MDARAALDVAKRAVNYNRLGSCRRYGLDPFDYRKDLFPRLPSVKITEIQRFAPTVWAKAEAHHITRSAIAS